MIIGIGCDIVSLDRIERAIAKHGEHFLNNVLTPWERETYDIRPDRKLFFGGRWAAKEACAKALGCGIGAGAGFAEIAVIHDNHGAPKLSLSGNALATADKLGVKTIHVTISHDSGYAAAFVVLEKAPPTPKKR